MVQAVCRQPLIARVRITSKAEFVMGTVGLESKFDRVLRVLRVIFYASVKIISLWLNRHLVLYHRRGIIKATDSVFK
jgi:hypothetical protein